VPDPFVLNAPLIASRLTTAASASFPPRANTLSSDLVRLLLREVLSSNPWLFDFCLLNRAALFLASCTSLVSAVCCYFFGFVVFVALSNDKVVSLLFPSS
jgi:hypothetical protein